MIQINLLPDVKQQFIKTRRTKRLIILISTLAAGASVAIMCLLLLITNVQQAGTITDLDEEINTSLAELRSTKDLDKILTVQKQLGALNDIHKNKTDSTRLFSYLPQIIPGGVTLSDLKVDYEASIVEISGTAPSLGDVNTFVDTIKFTDYILLEGTDEASSPEKAFAEVVLASNSRDDTEVAFTITASFVPDIFLTDVEDITLRVPNTVTTRSETEQPGALFEAEEGATNE